VFFPPSQSSYSLTKNSSRRIVKSIKAFLQNVYYTTGFWYIMGTNYNAQRCPGAEP
jgi:hypothetical protein